MPSENEAHALSLSVDDISSARPLLEKLLARADGRQTEPSQTEKACLAGRVYDARRLRSKFFPEDIFADPAWDILLLLYSIEHAGKRISQSATCDSAGVPASTGQRWVERLINADLIYREKHPADGRVYWLRLSERTLERLNSYFGDMAGSLFRGHVSVIGSPGEQEPK